MKSTDVDVLIIGAGLSGIGAACHLQRKLPNKTYKILESKPKLGGTWGLFRYPGIRSDSDMYTLGYSFKPWKHAKTIPDGASILDYIIEAAEEHNVPEHILYEHETVSLDWDRSNSMWTVTSTHLGQEVTLTSRFVISCTGYYDHKSGYQPEFTNSDVFNGSIVHPQHWPDDLDYSGKKVVVIGSGATAITLIPSMAEDTQHITMLQRSPSYVATLPAQDKIADWLRKCLPEKVAYTLIRCKNVAYTTLVYQMSRRNPELVKRELKKEINKRLSDPTYADKHFTPRYNPWDERLCLAPDGDIFTALEAGKASIVTDHIEQFTETGIQLTSGEHLEADIIVTATGLNLKVLGGMSVSTDGEAVDLSQCMTYKGMLLTGIPNLSIMLGYTNASWTLKSDLTTQYMCRLIDYMDENGFTAFEAVNEDPSVEERPFMSLASGYVDRMADQLPKQGSKAPWMLHQNYTLDFIKLKCERVNDGVVKFSR